MNDLLILLVLASSSFLLSLSIMIALLIQLYLLNKERTASNERFDRKMKELSENHTHNFIGRLGVDTVLDGHSSEARSAHLTRR